MVEATYTKQVINADDRQFQVPRSIEATFYNTGSDIVFIDGVKLNPESTFRLGASSCILSDTTVEILFEGKLKSKLVLIYNAPINC